MASLHRQQGKPNWFCAYTDANGKRHLKSTGTSNKKQAKVICDGIARGEKLSKQGALTNSRARRILEDALADLMAATGNPLHQNPVGAFLETWLADIRHEIQPKTFGSYKAITK